MNLGDTTFGTVPFGALAPRVGDTTLKQVNQSAQAEQNQQSATATRSRQTATASSSTQSVQSK